MTSSLCLRGGRGRRRYMLAAVFGCSPELLGSLAQVAGIDFRERAIQDLLRRSGGLNLPQQAGVAVEVDERACASLVGFEPNLDGLGTVVFALKKLAPATVALAFELGWSLDDVIDGFALLAGAAACEPGHDGLGRKLVTHDGGEAEAFTLHQLREGNGLAQGAGEPVENESTAALETGTTFANQLPDGGIGHKLSATHRGEGIAHGGTLFAIGTGAGSAKDVASGEMAGTQPLMQQVGLCSLADARSAEQDESPRRYLVGRRQFAVAGGSLEPSCTIAVIRRSHALGIGEGGWAGSD